MIYIGLIINFYTGFSVQQCIVKVSFRKLHPQKLIWDFSNCLFYIITATGFTRQIDIIAIESDLKSKLGIDHKHRWISIEGEKLTFLKWDASITLLM